MKNAFAYRMYLLYCAVVALSMALMSTAAGVYYIRTVEMDAFQLLMTGFALELSVFLFEIPTGVVADLYSRKRSMAIGLLMVGCGFLLQGVVPLFVAVLAAQVLWGVGYTFLSGADQAWIADELKTKRLEGVFLRGTQIGQMFSLLGMLAGVLLANVALNLPLILSGLLLIGLSPVAALAFPETGFAPSPALRHNPWRSAWDTFKTGLWTMRRSPLLKAALLISLLTGLYSEGFDRLWTLHLLENVTLPGIGNLNEVVWIGLINAGALVMNILAVEGIRRRLERTGRLEKVWVLLMLNGLLVLAIVVFALAGEWWIALAAYWAAAVLRKTNEPIYSAWLNEQIRDSRRRATILSTQGQVNSLGEIFGGPLVGAVVWKGTVSAGLIASGVILAPVVVLYLLLWRKGAVGGEISSRSA
ncbi:MFS transporter, DHA3 family, tetracycline resistance protein [Planifilum fulgidum]|uniref:MFS transporter, DHA3 family, tetracycline resistance protein n=1 Tax=Planifilum fulgidum TaxID=201973 RepID=A0A1I2KQE6_9BACL|nr:MFS transporter [Planifilum fulgidum]SFF68743.1 MFS transporter, DHA3 family, tetracycline resistance protein [Planifilum fulgidum]